MAPSPQPSADVTFCSANACHLTIRIRRSVRREERGGTTSGRTQIRMIGAAGLYEPADLAKDASAPAPVALTSAGLRREQAGTSVNTPV